MVALGTAGVRKGREVKGQRGEMGENPVPLRNNYTKIGEGGWYRKKITRQRRGADAEEWGEAFTPERVEGLAREPGRTPHGGNTRELERP